MSEKWRKAEREIPPVFAPVPG